MGGSKGKGVCGERGGLNHRRGGSQLFFGGLFVDIFRGAKVSWRRSWKKE
jgi:hypothetical protein